MVKFLRESGWARTPPLCSQSNPILSGGSLSKLYQQSRRKKRKYLENLICLDTCLEDLGRPTISRGWVTVFFLIPQIIFSSGLEVSPPHLYPSHHFQPSCGGYQTLGTSPMKSKGKLSLCFSLCDVHGAPKRRDPGLLSPLRQAVSLLFTSFQNVFLPHNKLPLVWVCSVKPFVII